MTSDQASLDHPARARSAFRVRALKEDDWVAFRALRLAALSDTPEAFGASHAEEAARPEAFFRARLAADPPSQVFGAFSNDDLVGIAGFLAGSSAKARHKGQLWGVYVRPDRRKDGVGQALVEAVVAHAARHVTILQARVVTTNRAAHTLYSRLGFTPYGIESKALCVDGTFYDEALLARDFSQGADA